MNTIDPTLRQLSCGHHWIIEPATGPISQGECRRCGMLKEFKNSIAKTATDGQGNTRKTTFNENTPGIDYTDHKKE